MNKHPLIVYIVGAGRSGSTLVDMVLGAHSQIFSLGEIVYWPQLVASNKLCACRVPVRECDVWRSVIDQLQDDLGVNNLLDKPHSVKLRISGSSGTALDRLLYRIKSIMALTIGNSTLRRAGIHLVSDRRAVDMIFSFYNVVSQISHSPILVDSSKAARRAQLLCFERPDVPYRVIHLIRDGRGYVHSCMKQTYTIERPIIDGDKVKMVSKEYPDPHPQTAFQASRGWLRINLVTLLALHTLPAKYCLRLRYEDFCTDPAGELERLCRFIGVPDEGQMLDFRSFVHHNIGGNAVRFRSQGIMKPDDAWRTALSHSDLKVFERTAGWLNRYFGYL